MRSLSCPISLLKPRIRRATRSRRHRLSAVSGFDKKSSVPASLAMLTDGHSSLQLPDKTVTAQAHVADGRLTRVQTDLGQLAATPLSDPVKLVTTFSARVVAITAPRHATPVDLSQLGDVLGLLQGLAK